MSGSGQPTKPPLKVEKVRFGGRVVGTFATWSTILNAHRYMPKNFSMDHKITFLNWEMKWGKSLYDE